MINDILETIAESGRDPVVICRFLKMKYDIHVQPDVMMIRLYHKDLEKGNAHKYSRAIFDEYNDMPDVGTTVVDRQIHTYRKVMYRNKIIGIVFMSSNGSQFSHNFIK